MSVKQVFKKSVEKANEVQTEASESAEVKSSVDVDATGNPRQIPKHWEAMRKISRGSGSIYEISREAMESLGIPYKIYRLHEKVTTFFHTGDKDKDGNPIRVHMNRIPVQLLQVLYHTTHPGIRHGYLNYLHGQGVIGGRRDDYAEYSRGDRAHIAQIDEHGELLEIPESLEKALRYDKKYFDATSWSQRWIKAFYLSSRARKILYHTAPPEERCDYLLDEDEHKAALGIEYPVTDEDCRVRLVDSIGVNRDLADLTDDLEKAILDGRVVSQDELLDFLSTDDEDEYDEDDE